MLEEMEQQGTKLIRKRKVKKLEKNCYKWVGDVAQQKYCNNKYYALYIYIYIYIIRSI